jgi:Sec-independent protein translocase protein TatA
VDEKTRRLAELLKEAVDIYGAELPYILGELNKRFGTSLGEMEKVQKEREKIQTEQKPVQKDQTVQKEQKPVQKDQTVQTVREDSTRSRCDAFGGSVLATCQAAWRDYKAGHSVPLSRLYNLGPGTESLDNN